jgi:DNA-binding NtrC family response regulator
MPGGSAKTVLVINEESAIFTMFQIALSDQGFTVHVASSAAQALEVCDKHPVGAILADLDFLGKDGALHLLSSIRQLRPDVRICLMTASLPSYTADDLRPIGVSCCLSKPIHLEQLITTMEQQCAGQDDK